MPDAPSNADIVITIPIRKVEAEKRLVYGIVLQPGTAEDTDAHKDWVSAATIEKAAHAFLTRYHRQSQLGLQHTVFGEIGVDLAECYIAPVDFELGGEAVTKGSWVMVTKVVDDALWEDVKSGKFTGYSIGGVATVAATSSASG
jgi:hypothetical protein